jgi:hypothetical protein
LLENNRVRNEAHVQFDAGVLELEAVEFVVEEQSCLFGVASHDGVVVF